MIRIRALLCQMLAARLANVRIIGHLVLAENLR